MPRISHHRRPLGGGRGSRRNSGGRPAASAPYTPASDPLSLLWWDPTTVSGSVSSWVDKIAAVAASQGTAANRPTQSSAAIGGVYPGVTSDGGDSLTAAGAGAVLSGKTTLTITCAMVDASAASTVALELTTAATTIDGGFGFYPNNAAGGLPTTAIRGTTGATQRYISEAFATVKVVSIGLAYATAGADAVPFVRVNGVAQALTSFATASVAGSAANASLYMFARGGASLFWPGTFGDIVIRNSVTQDAALEAVEDYIAARCGLSF